MSQDKNVKTQTYWDKHDMPRVPVSTALNYLKQAIRHKRKRGVITMIGDAGVGKTQGVHQIAREHDYRVKDFRTAQFNLISAGVPQRAEGDHFKIAVPDDMPREGEKCILLFDEINQGTPQAVSMFFQLLEDRSLYNYRLPDDTIIVALMNPATAEYSVSRIESNAALNRRLKKFYVYSTFADWIAHAKTENFHHSDGMRRACHPIVQRYLSAKPTALYDDKARGLGKQFAAPATWQTVSLDLYMQEADGAALTSDETKFFIGSTVGMTVADDFVTYVMKNETIISATEILTNYRPNSKIRKAVQKELESGGGDIARLQEEVPTILMADKPPVEEIADNFALFVSDLAESSPARAEALYTHLRCVALEEAGGQIDANREYMKGLNLKLRHNQNFRAVHELFSKLHSEMVSPGAQDPMAD